MLCNKNAALILSSLPGGYHLFPALKQNRNGHYSWKMCQSTPSNIGAANSDK